MADGTFDNSPLPLIAYRLVDPALEISVANADRAWMHATPRGFALGCLPLRVANEGGWFILNHERVDVVWSGEEPAQALELTHRAIHRHLLPISDFGCGLLAWKIPYLFRTPPGYNLIVRGPTNWLKDGACPLDAVVETDWTAATFTMIWKITRPGFKVTFEAGEPVCMILPQKRCELKRFLPEIRELERGSAEEIEYQQWAERRRENAKKPWQHDGVTPPPRAAKYYSSSSREPRVNLMPFRMPLEREPSR